MVMDDLPLNAWYPVFLGHEVTEKPTQYQRFGLMWVTFRTGEGRPVMAQDRCPHLGASLSKGTLQDETLVCPFHGFRFDAEGVCREVPALGSKGRVPKGLCLDTIPLFEQSGWIFGWWGDGPPVPPRPDLFEVFDATWAGRSHAKDWDVHITRAIENQLDVAHLPFVHRKSIGAGGKTVVEGPFTVSDDRGIRIWVTNKKDDGLPPRSLTALEDAAATTPPSLELRFPALWQLRIHDQLLLIVGFVPIHNQKTRFLIHSAHRVQWPVIRWLYGMTLAIANRFILREDERVVSTIRPFNAMDAESDQLIAADRAIVLFRKAWRARKGPRDPSNPP